ncbi:MmcQ/YjbR family DNA-binding protein [Aquirufa sp. ROCK2-A2]
MYLDEIVEFALSLPNAEETMPFGPNHLVMKVNNKMLLLLDLESMPIQFNVKCQPEKAIELREDFPESIFPGWHMNKKHWNTILVNAQLSQQQIKDFILHSYQLVKKK